MTTVDDEIFQSAPLEEVAYEVRFPGLFHIYQAIGEFQLEIMDDFPRPSQFDQVGFAIENLGSGVPKLSTETSEKPRTCWQFKSESGRTKVRVKVDSLAIISNEYKSYDNPGNIMFKDIIIKIVSKFLEKIPIKKFSRIGLRYIDHCPLDDKTNSYFMKYYIPTFDLNKYRIEDSIKSHFVMVTQRDDYNLVFQSGIDKINEKYKYVMDFDGSALNIDSSKYSSITDDLHKMLRKEFNSCITEEFKQYMRGNK